MSAERLAECHEAEVAVVGAGPAGIVVALELARAGHDVLLVESGGERFDARTQALGETVPGDPLHVSMALATQRSIGGASNLWGGRCVPFDPVDFEPRAAVGDAAWPLDYEEFAAYLPRACEWARCGDAEFDATRIPELMGRTIVPGFLDGEVRATELERWSLPTNFGREYGAELQTRPNLRLLTGLTVTEVVARRHGSGSEVGKLRARRIGGGEAEVVARRYVLAAGGLETTRLLFASDAAHPGGIGNHSGHLGHWYMAHTEAKVARAVFDTPPAATIVAHERDADGVYVRRRFTLTAAAQRRRGLPNSAIWIVNPPPADPAHGSGILSFVYLALASPLGRYAVAEGIRREHLRSGTPPSLLAHLRNVARDAVPATRWALRFGHERYLRRGRKAPGFFVRSATNTYPLLYHGEHLPHFESTALPSSERDGLGMPRLRTQLRFSDADVGAVRAAHEALDESLRTQRLGRVEFFEQDVEAAVRHGLFGGYHQAGTARMSARPGDGVVDRDLAVHGFDDLFVAGSATFPTSGQANSTLTLVALSVRLADHLRAGLRSGERPVEVAA